MFSQNQNKKKIIFKNNLSKQVPFLVLKIIFKNN